MQNKNPPSFPPIRSAKQFGNAIQRIRKARALTQSQLSESAGLRQAGLSQIESGANGVRLFSLFKLLAALNLEIVLRKRGA